MNEEQEEWRDVYNFVGLYQVSNLGRVKMLWRGTYLRPHILNIFYKNGYPHVTLTWEGHHWQKLVSRLVATAFVPNPDKYNFVLHKDGDITNNRADNLYWGKNHDNFPEGSKFTKEQWEEFKKSKNNACNSQ